ncbi:membrane protein [Anopheles sinensis]|uniref:Membrane protein n=1 Tax=Anopheles sinensis TaxID=74873 RepID=A0A084W1F1_ANOSI|nr:membrane protein [Anopheles sinensis]
MKHGFLHRKSEADHVRPVSKWSRKQPPPDRKTNSFKLHNAKGKWEHKRKAEKANEQ